MKKVTINTLRNDLGPEDFNEVVPKTTINLGYRGSIAYGTEIDDSDIDLMGVHIAPISYYFGLQDFCFKNQEQSEYDVDPWDCVNYEIRKFFQLLLKSNPNVMERLWLNEESTIYRSSTWDRIVENRELFVSKQVFKHFSGYAKGQMHRMTHIGKVKLGEKRRQLVLKFGYDVKNACHCVRLMRQCIEFAKTGEIFVDRTGIDADELKVIKSGGWELERVEAKMEELFEKSEALEAKSTLPKNPDFHKANGLLIDILNDHFK